MIILLANLKAAFKEWRQDKVSRLGAALSYYSVFSAAPLLLVLIGVVGLVYGNSAAQSAVTSQIQDALGSTASNFFQTLLLHLTKHTTNVLVLVVGIGITLIGALGVFVQLKDAFNTIWKVDSTTTGGLLGTIRAYFLSFLSLLIIGVLFLLFLTLNSIVSHVAAHLPSSHLTIYIWQTLNEGISLAVFFLLFAILFKLLPDKVLQWHEVRGGAFLTALLFTLGKYVLGIYLTKSNIGSAYGAAGSLVLLLVWVYYSAQIVLFGVEYIKVSLPGYRSHTHR